jgi:hypothetical protein
VDLNSSIPVAATEGRPVLRDPGAIGRLEPPGARPPHLLGPHDAERLEDGQVLDNGDRLICGGEASWLTMTGPWLENSNRSRPWYLLARNTSTKLAVCQTLRV